MKSAKKDFDNDEGLFNPDLCPHWIKIAKRELAGYTHDSAESYHLLVAEYVDQQRVLEILEKEFGFKSSGASNISASLYMEKDVGVGEYDAEYDCYEDYKTYRVRISDHMDYHGSMAEKTFQINYRRAVADWSDVDCGPDLSTEEIKQRLKDLMEKDFVKEVETEVSQAADDSCGLCF